MATRAAERKPVIRDSLGRFPPGISGNPRGPKPMDAKAKVAFRDLSEKALRALGEIIEDPHHQQRERACEYVCDRRWGKVSQLTPLMDEDDENGEVIDDETALRAGKVALSRLLQEPELATHALEVLDGGKK